MTLDRLPLGHSAVVVKVGKSENRRRLLEMGIVPGTVVIAGRRSPFGDPCEILLRGYSLTLRRLDLACIVIKEADS